MKHKISKSFSFAYGHRVWSQQLDSEFADNLQCACRHLHGHEGRVELTLAQKPHPTGYEQPLVRGMVTDFRHTEFLKRFLDSTIDHKFILDIDDPLKDQILGATGESSIELVPVYLERTNGSLTQSRLVGRKVLPTWLDAVPGYQQTPQEEYLESFFIVDFVPTSENLSKWLFDLVEWKMERMCAVESVDWWETAKSHSLYSRS